MSPSQKGKVVAGERRRDTRGEEKSLYRDERERLDFTRGSGDGEEAVKRGCRWVSKGGWHDGGGGGGMGE